MDVHVDTSEVDALAADLAAAGAKAAAGSLVVVGLAARELHARAQAAAPVRTGELSGSIRVQGSGLEVTVGSDVRQGFYQEFGTSVMSPQPWLYPNAGRAEASLTAGIEKLADPL